MDTTRILTISRLSDCLCVPVKSSTRLKYSSVAVSSSVICLGTNTGSTYVFDRETFKLIKFISSKGGNVELLEFSKDGKLLAIADSGGTVTCLEIDEEKHSFKVIKEIEDHKGSKLTSLCWDDDSARLFIGDERGVVTAVIVTPYKLPAGKFLSKSSVEIVIKGESPIIQLDYAKVKLLISTTTRTLLCLTDRSKYQQVGSKPRDGRFGSCFLQYVDGEIPVIYAARPGSRLWEVDFNGQVLATHQFKYLLGVPPKKLFGHSPKFLSKTEENWDKPQSLAFPCLQQLCNRYLVTWSQNGLYILDPSLGKVAGWFDQIKGIKDICCHNESIYVLLNDGQVSELEFLPVKKCLKTLMAMGEYTQAAEVAIQAQEEILNHVESFLTIDFDYILEKLQAEENAKLHDSLEQLIHELQVKHDLVRSEIQERLNRIANLDDSSTPCDSGVEDNDETRSNHSEIGSETSSRLSLTRLPQIDVDSVLRRATSAVVNKIVSSGFMKKALKEVLEADVNIPNDQPSRSPLQIRKLEEVHPIEATTTSVVNNKEVESIQISKETAMGNQEFKSLNSSIIGNVEVDGIRKSPRLSTHIGRRRKKAKVVTVDIESPQKDDPYKQPAYDVSDKMHMKRNMSLGATIPYAPHPDLRRLSSLQKPTDPYESENKDVQNKLQSPLEHAPKIPTIFKQAKQLVRNIIHHEPPGLLGVASRSMPFGDNYKPLDKPCDSASCLLTSQEALKHIQKFVDVTAVCRNKLRDSRVLFNSKTVRKILQDWAETLNETMKNFAKTFTAEIKLKNEKHKINKEETQFLMIRIREEFFSSLGAAFSEVSNLASLCFETGIFPVACSNISDLDFSIIDHRTTFADIRRNVIDMLNKDDKQDGIIQNEVPQESAPSTLLSIANNYLQEQRDVDSDFGGDSVDNQDNQGNSEESRLQKENTGRSSGKSETRENRDEDEYKELNQKVSRNSIDDEDSNVNRGRCKTVKATTGKMNLANAKIDQNEQTDVMNSTLNEYVEISESTTLVVDEKKTFLPECIESVLCTAHNPVRCQSCAEDICRACFVLWYFPLLDIHKIRTVLSLKRGCRWRTWLAYLVHLEDVRSSKELKTAISSNDYGKVARILRDSTTTESFFSYLRRIFTFSPHLVLDFCTERDINPWEVSFIYMANSENSDALNDFLGYISAMKRIKPALNLYEDVSVAMTTLYCGLKRSAVSNTMNYCDCGGARKGAHLLSWRWKSHIDDLIKWLVKTEDIESGIIHRVLKLCREYGYWFGCIQVFRNRRDHKSSFELLCQLGDFQLLDNYIQKDTFTITDHDLEYLYQLKCHRKDINDSVKCRPAIPDFTPNICSESIARVLVRELGAKTTLNMLEKFTDEEFGLLGNFYYDCMRIAEKEMEQRYVAMKILEKLNNEICDENKSVIDKHIELLKNKELNGYSDIMDESMDEAEVKNKLFDSTALHHWGIGLNLSSSNCPCCTLPLCIHGSSANAGLIVFDCGHTFHKQCIPEESCLMCYYNLENFEDKF